MKHSEKYLNNLKCLNKKINKIPKYTEFVSLWLGLNCYSLERHHKSLSFNKCILQYNRKFIV